MKCMLRGFFILALVGMFSAGFVFHLFLNTSASSSDKKIIFEVRPGPFIVVARELKTQGLISNIFLLRAYAKLTSQAESVQVGEYMLDYQMTPRKILTILSSGESIEYSVTFKEGINLYDIANILEEKKLVDKKRFVELCHDKSFIRELLGEERYSLEGYLFPDTYKFNKQMGAREIIRGLVRQFHKNIKLVLSANNKLSMELHDFVILASIIEKETSGEGERGLVSSVFHNRLKKKMRLSADPTIIYGILDKTGVHISNIRKKHINDRNNIYNTYRRGGLPFGPISNPGRESLSAALNPSDSNYLYFVSRNDGTHVFSKTLKEHNAAVRKFQLDRRARQGKSWRDLHKK